MSIQKHVVSFRSNGRGRAQCAPNPKYPNGIDIDATSPGDRSCLVSLPYPAPECGLVVVECFHCDMNIALTAAGRVDDPRSIRIPCRVSSNASAN